MQKRICAALLLLLMLLTLPVCAMTSDDVPYTTYQYTNKGDAIASPHAYIPQDYVTGADMGTTPLKTPGDLKVDSKGNVYIADTGNNRIVILDDSFKVKKILNTFENQGKSDKLAHPAGIFVTEDQHLYVSDQDNRRILEFDSNLSLVRTIQKPNASLLPADYNFSPSAISVDKWGRIYVISEGTTYGIMEFSAEGIFRAFVGSQKVTVSVGQKFWRLIFTKEQISRSFTATPINYNNLTVDDDGFLYATSEHPDATSVANTIKSGSKDNTFLPLKEFNFNGTDVLERSGKYAPAGDISFETSYSETSKNGLITGASTISSVCLGESGIYFLGDSKRNKIFAYDVDGNLLYVFGGTGSRKGMFQSLKSISYYNGCLYGLDSTLGTITRFKLTSYGELINEAIQLSSDRKYDQVVSKWKEILTENNNFNLAYVGMGNSELRAGNYSSAMKYFHTADYGSGYSKAFVFYRKALLSKWFLLVLLAALGAIAGIARLFKGINRYNSRPTPGKRTMKDHMLYSFHVIFHPFDGFWDIVHEQRGSAKAATVLLVLAALSIIIREMITGFIFGGTGEVNVGATLLVMAGVVLLFCLANWCLTSLSDGKGTMRDIYIVIGYSVTPLVLLSILIGLLTNALSSEEAGFVAVLTAVAYIWTGLLLFFGILTVHQYTLGQNLLSVLCTLVGMIIILFIGFLLYNLFGRIIAFVGNIITEISLRL